MALHLWQTSRRLVVHELRRGASPAEEPPHPWRRGAASEHRSIMCIMGSFLQMGGFSRARAELGAELARAEVQNVVVSADGDTVEMA